MLIDMQIFTYNTLYWYGVVHSICYKWVIGVVTFFFFDDMAAKCFSIYESWNEDVQVNLLTKLPGYEF